jgi:2-oxoglutarate ferredoxin oxidoreductase subunit delta
VTEKEPPVQVQSPAPKARKVRGTIHLNAGCCKGCGFCIAFCPPKVLEFSPEFNPQGYHFPRLANPDGCTGCDLCGLYCPDFAIYGVMLKYAAPANGPAQTATGVPQEAAQ